MKCKKCEKQIPDDSRYCEFCGASLVPWYKKTWFLLVCGFLIVVLVLCMVLSVWNVPPKNTLVVTAKTEDFTGMDIYPMIWVEGGSFVMGNNELNAEEGDCPEHTVTLDGFWIGQFEVSQGFWNKVMGYNPSEYQPSKKENGKPFTTAERDQLPVESVAPDEVAGFIKILNEMTGKKFALPSEAQWEYAARGGNKSKGGKFANGEMVPREIWFEKRFPIRANAQTITNELGIYHMSGNVAEWCRDYYSEDFYSASRDMKNPVCSVESPLRCVRGGSFQDDRINSIVVFHRSLNNSAREYIGFRLIMNDN